MKVVCFMGKCSPWAGGSESLDIVLMSLGNQTLCQGFKAVLVSELGVADINTQIREDNCGELDGTCHFC